MIHEQANEIREALVGNDIRAVTDPRRIDPPCVLIVPESATFGMMQPGDGATDWVLNVLAPPPGAGDAFNALSALTSQVIATVPDVQEVRMTSYRSDDGDPWPCFELRFRAVSSWG